MFYIYIIKNNERSKIYIGHSSDLKNRLKRHNGLLKNKTKSFTSKNKGIWKLIHNEKYKTREEAIKREKWLKSGVGREYIKKHILGK
jgi:putative endonuclease